MAPLGALGFGIGTSEVEHVLATQTLVYRLAKDMRIHISGRLPVGTTAKDLILMVIGQIGAQGAARLRGGVHRQGHPRAVGGGALHAVQHGGGGRRARRADRP